MFVLSEIFGECPQVKILEAFATKPNQMLYLTEIERMTCITKITIADHINKLIKEGIVEKKEKVGRKQYYQLNKDNPKVTIILSLVKHIEDQHLEELIKKDIVSNNDESEVSTDNDYFATCHHTQSNSGYENIKTSSTDNL